LGSGAGGRGDVYATERKEKKLKKLRTDMGKLGDMSKHGRGQGPYKTGDSSRGEGLPSPETVKKQKWLRGSKRIAWGAGLTRRALNGTNGQTERPKHLH